MNIVIELYLEKHEKEWDPSNLTTNYTYWITFKFILYFIYLFFLWLKNATEIDSVFYFNEKTFTCTQWRKLHRNVKTTTWSQHDTVSSAQTHLL